MNNFWTLVKFQYKKIFVRKSVIVVIMLALIATVFTVSGIVLGTNHVTGMTNYEEMLMDKEYKLALSNKVLDGELKASRAYQQIPANIYPYSDSEEYQKIARPYSSIYRLIGSAYSERGHGFNLDDLQNISEKDAYGYYEKRISQYRLNLENNPLFTAANVEKVMKLDSAVKKPFIMQYTEGYTRFFSFSATNAFIVSFLIAFILSPIFSNEYQNRTDSLILTSKNGKCSQILAKLFTAVTFSSLVTIGLLTFGYLLCMCIFGFEGANAPIQLYTPLLTYNFTMIEVVILLFIITLFASFLMTGICVCLSSAMSKSISVLAIGVIVILLGIFNGITIPGFEKIRYF